MPLASLLYSLSLHSRSVAYNNNNNVVMVMMIKDEREDIFVVCFLKISRNGETTATTNKGQWIQMAGGCAGGRETRNRSSIESEDLFLHFGLL